MRMKKREISKVRERKKESRAVFKDGMNEKKTKENLEGENNSVTLCCLSSLSLSRSLHHLLCEFLLLLLWVFPLLSVFQVHEEKKSSLKKNDSSFSSIHRPAVRFARESASQKAGSQ